MNRFEQINARPVAEVATALGYKRTDKTHIGPCPACGEQRRSRTDSRLGPLFLTHKGQRWECGACKEAGGSSLFVCYVVVGRRLGKGDPGWRRVLEECASRGWCDGLSDGAAAAPRTYAKPLPAPEPDAPLARPTTESVADVWTRASLVTDDADVTAWLRRRGLDPDAVAELDLARALPRGPLPTWARMMGHPWSDGWRCILPAYGVTGQIESLRARWVHEGPPPPRCEKACGAAAGQGSASRLVLADGIGRQVLERRNAPDWWPPERPLQLLVVEGEPDFLTLATSGGLDAGVLGIWNGSWCDELADRIPDGARVAVRVHQDKAGVRYANKIVRSLWTRCGVYTWGDRVAAA